MLVLSCSSIVPAELRMMLPDVVVVRLRLLTCGIEGGIDVYTGKVEGWCWLRHYRNS